MHSGMPATCDPLPLPPAPPLPAPIASVARRLAVPGRCAQVCPPRVITCPFRLRQRLAMCVRSAKTSQVTTLPEPFARDEEGHHRLGATPLAGLRHGRRWLVLRWFLSPPASRCTGDHDK